MNITSFAPSRLPREVRVKHGRIESWDDASQEHALDFLRFYRNIMLSQSDWTQGSDSPLSDSKKSEWAEYRQALRDITENVVDAKTVEIPDKPV